MAKPSILSRWSGPASMVGTVLLILQVALSSALGPGQGTSNPYDIYDPLLYVLYNVLFGAALLLFAVGLVGLHDRRALRSERSDKMSRFLAVSAGALAVVGIPATLVVGL